MKKILIALMAILYMASASGVAMEIHYCMGKKSGVEFYGSESKKCGRCGMTEKKGCCNDKHQFYKIKDAHTTVATAENFTDSHPAIIGNYIAYNWPLNNKAVELTIQDHAPQNFTRPSLCILNCIFRL